MQFFFQFLERKCTACPCFITLLLVQSPGNLRSVRGVPRNSGSAYQDFYQYYGGQLYSGGYGKPTQQYQCPPTFVVQMVTDQGSHQSHPICACPYGYYQTFVNRDTPYCAPYGQYSPQPTQAPHPSYVSTPPAAHKPKKPHPAQQQPQEIATKQLGGDASAAATPAPVAASATPAPTQQAPEPQINSGEPQTQQQVPELAPALVSSPVPNSDATSEQNPAPEGRLLTPPTMDNSDQEPQVAGIATDENIESEENASRKDTAVAMAVVGSIGAMVVIAAVAAMFIIRKRRRTRVTGGLPAHVRHAPTYHKYPEPMVYFHEEDLVCPDSPIFVAPHSAV